MKKQFFMVASLLVLISAQSKPMQGGWKTIVTLSFASWVAQHDNHPEIQVPAAQEYPHKPEQLYRMKKTQQPQAQQRRQFNQNHK
jgi:hypothetical protein